MHSLSWVKNSSGAEQHFLHVKKCPRVLKPTFNQRIALTGNNREPVLTDHVERRGFEEHEADHQGNLPHEPRQFSYGHTGPIECLDIIVCILA